MRDVRHRHGTWCRGCGVPKTGGSREEKRARATVRLRSEKRLDEIRYEIVDQAEKWLAGWVAAQRRRNPGQEVREACSTKSSTRGPPGDWRIWPPARRDRPAERGTVSSARADEVRVAARIVRDMARAVARAEVG